MGTILLVMFIICAIITFKIKDKRFPNHPILGWIVCMILIAVGLYLMYSSYNEAADKAAYNAGYREGLK